MCEKSKRRMGVGGEKSRVVVIANARKPEASNQNFARAARPNLPLSFPTLKKAKTFFIARMHAPHSLHTTASLYAIYQPLTGGAAR